MIYHDGSISVFRPNPGKNGPAKKFWCIQCNHSVGPIFGEWNQPVGRWLYEFDCPECHCHQEMFASEFSNVRKEPTASRKPYND
jgi:hypothetical protein